MDDVTYKVYLRGNVPSKCPSHNLANLALFNMSKASRQRINEARSHYIDSMDTSTDKARYEPLPRWGHVSVAIGDKVFVWGGRIEDFSKESKKKLASMVEVFDVHTELWEQKTTNGTPPNGLYDCAYTVIGNKIYVYGGWDGHTNHGSLHSLDTTTMKWEELIATDSSLAPMKMSGCGLVSYGNEKLILFGGYGAPVSGQKVKGVRFKSNKPSEAGEATETGEAGGASVSNKVDEEEEEVKTMTNELKVFDITAKSWSSPSASGDCPPPCVDFSFTRVDEYRALVFGGFQPEIGTTSDAYILNMDTWHWHKLGSDAESVSSSAPWPTGRDGHASCVLSEGQHPQVLVTGGWDKHNKLLYDSWVLNITLGTWTELSGLGNPAAVGPRFWHSVASFACSKRLRQLVFFGGCPSAPTVTDDGASWDKLAATVLVDMGQVEQWTGHSYSDVFEGAPNPGGEEWVVLDIVNHSQMGQPLRRMREKVLFAEYRATRAESVVRDTIRKMETMSLRRSVTPLQDAEIFASVNSLNKDTPFWVIPRQNVEITPTEIGRGKWAVVRVAVYRGEKVAAKCLTTPIFSEDNRKTFIECMDMAAKMHHHPNLLRFYGAVLDGEPIIITELMETNLRVLADKSQLLYHQVVEIALGIAKALEFLHGTKPDPIIHGDLTCTSVLLEKGKGNKWKVKLSDFMTAKFFKQLIAMDPSLERAFSPNFREKSISPARFDRESSPAPHSQSSESHFSGAKSKNRKESITAPDILDLTQLTTPKDVYHYGLVLVETCTGSLPLEVSLSFLIESIQWPEMSGLAKECLSFNPAVRPSMTDIVEKLTTLSHAISISHTRPFHGKH